MKEGFIKQVSENILQATEGRLLDQDFQIVTLSMMTVVKLLENSSSSVFPDTTIKAIESYQRATKRLQLHSKTFEDMVIERNYINTYFHFEEFMFKSLQTLYTFFPKFLLKEDYAADYEDLFDQSDIAYLREKVIEKKVKSIVQGSNIYNLINRFDSIFKIKLDLESECLHRLFVVSQKRNILIHNNGIVNNIYQTELRKRSIPNDLQHGEYVLKSFNDHDGLKETWHFIRDVITKISAGMIKDFHRLENYHNSLTRN